VGNLIADSMKKVGKTQIALQNSGGIKGEIHEGPVTLRTLYNILPFENNLVTLSLKGWELENLIEEGLAGNAGFLQSSGISCIYSSSNPPGFRIIQIDINNTPLEFNKTYSLTVNDFMAENDKDWPELYHADDKKVLGLMRENFEDYLRNQASITPKLEKRFKDFEELDETLRIQALSFELATLPESIKHNGELTSEYARLLAEVCRLETQSDFALIPASLILPTREELKVITPARVISDFASKEGIITLKLPGKIIEKIINASMDSATTPIAFSGFSVERLEAGENKIIAWDSNYNPDNIYEVALNENFPLYSEGYYDLRAYNRLKYSNDIRRSFINGLRRRNGQVKIKRAIY
ncbi:MAG: 5'-nucleotidase C-terminal domain-containing protein, partial [Candidatus Rifleibacteriota bacterium]